MQLRYALRQIKPLCPKTTFFYALILSAAKDLRILLEQYYNSTSMPPKKKSQR